MEAKYKGIDVSKWQGDINWEKVRASGVEFAMLRAGFGRCQGQNDTSFEEITARQRKTAYLSAHTITVTQKPSRTQKRRRSIFSRLYPEKALNFPWHSILRTTHRKTSHARK